MGRVRSRKIKGQDLIAMVVLTGALMVLIYVVEHPWVMLVALSVLVLAMVMFAATKQKQSSGPTSSHVELDPMTHGLPEYVPGTSTKILSSPRKPTRLFEKPRASLTEADIYLLNELRKRYGARPFMRGQLDAGRLSRLLGREIIFVGEADEFSTSVMLQLRSDQHAN